MILLILIHVVGLILAFTNVGRWSAKMLPNCVTDTKIFSANEVNTFMVLAPILAIPVLIIVLFLPLLDLIYKNISYYLPQ
jgi:hypothetical protein